MEHILLEKAYVYPLPKEDFVPDECIYDNKRGYWILEKTKRPFILSEYSRPPRSKKCDVETGEDQKGE